jgi:sigma-B regulation protein RsbU (phosphoserine phosphatase)
MLGRDGRFTYCNAGHNAPMLVSPGSGGVSVRRLETGGTVLGLFEHAVFEEETITLRPGDFIVAFSDGVTEALNPRGEEFTDDRLLASIAAHGDGAPKEILDGLLQDLRAFCQDATQNDDLTIVMVRFVG